MKQARHPKHELHLSFEFLDARQLVIVHVDRTIGILDTQNVRRRGQYNIGDELLKKLIDVPGLTFTPMTTKVAKHSLTVEYRTRYSSWMCTQIAQKMGEYFTVDRDHVFVDSIRHIEEVRR